MVAGKLPSKLNWTRAITLNCQKNPKLLIIIGFLIVQQSLFVWSLYQIIRRGSGQQQTKLDSFNAYHYHIISADYSEPINYSNVNGNESTNAKKRKKNISLKLSLITQRRIRRDRSSSVWRRTGAQGRSPGQRGTAGILLGLATRPVSLQENQEVATETQPRQHIGSKINSKFCPESISWRSETIPQEKEARLEWPLLFGKRNKWKNFAKRWNLSFESIFLKRKNSFHYRLNGPTPDRQENAENDGLWSDLGSFISSSAIAGSSWRLTAAPLM